MKCPVCGDEEALLLLQKILCVNTDCENYDDQWATEQGYISLDDENLLDLGFMTKTIFSSGTLDHAYTNGFIIEFKINPEAASKTVTLLWI